MKVGIVCEGRLAGEDAQVLEHFARRIVPQAEVKAFPQGTKPELFAKAGDVAKSLFDTGYDRVVIVWDIFPRWDKPDGEAQDLQDLDPSLINAGVHMNPCLYKVAIHKELEAWLLADGVALSAVLSRPAHPVSIKDNKHSDTDANPKKKPKSCLKGTTSPSGRSPRKVAISPSWRLCGSLRKCPTSLGSSEKSSRSNNSVGR